MRDLDAVVAELEALRGLVIRIAIDELPLDVVAQGVETQEQGQTLAGLDCARAQGYLFSPPLPGDRIAALLPASLTSSAG